MGLLLSLGTLHLQTNLVQEMWTWFSRVEVDLFTKLQYPLAAVILFDTTRQSNRGWGECFHTHAMALKAAICLSHALSHPLSSREDETEAIIEHHRSSRLPIGDMVLRDDSNVGSSALGDPPILAGELSQDVRVISAVSMLGQPLKAWFLRG